MFNLRFLASVYWPTISDICDKNIHYICQQSNAISGGNE